jgi:hypothetical protein
LGFGGQRKLRIVSLPTVRSRACGIDAANLRGHLVMMSPNLNCFGRHFPPIDFDSGPVWVQWRRLGRNWPLAVEELLFSHTMR